jgi:allantoate deiminase
MRFSSDRQRLQRDIEALAQYTSSPGQGVTRFSFTAEDRAAREYIKQQMAASHLQIREDAAGNVFGRREGRRSDAPAVMIGSHFDSVKNGGAFDGPAGVVAGLEIARILDENQLITDYPFEFVAMIEEEGGRFGAGLFGSRAMAGKVFPTELQNLRDQDGVSVAEAMRGFGLEPANITSAIRPADQLKAFFELHIEQGPILENAKAAVGLVETVVGIDQWEIEVQGRPDHAGTTPMDMRADALVAAADIVQDLYRLGKQAGAGTVATVGKLQVWPGAGNIVPGTVVFSVDIRSAAAAKIQHISEALRAAVYDLPERYPGVITRIKPVLSVKPTALSETVLQIFEEEARACGITTQRMVSGAGHDAMIMAELTEVGLIFVPSRGGRSHCPEEWTDYEQLQKGIDLLLSAILRMAEFRKPD